LLDFSSYALLFFIVRENGTESMGCGWGTPEEISQCLEVAKEWLDAARPWIEFGLSLAGVSSLVAFGIFIWVIKNCRRDLEDLRRNSDELRAASKRSIEAKEEAESKARIAERNLTLALESRGPADEQLLRSREQTANLNRKIELVRSASQGDATEFWSREPGPRLNDYARLMHESIPICLFANQKGGVGKTTLSANLAACFAARGERVLAIDLDYQGSLTSLMLAQARQRPDDFPSMVELLHQEKLPEFWQNTAIAQGSAHPNLDYVSCWYSFEKLERTMEYLWVLGEAAEDIRYRLARAVLSEHVQRNYQRVIVDAPPRMTSGFMNGFCTSTHLFVPTVIDNVSATAVGTFARQVKKLKLINPVLRLAGIIGTMTTVDRITKDSVPAADAAQRAVRNALNTNDNYMIRNAVMRRTPKVSYSTEAGIAYLQEPQTRPMFEALADEIALRAPLKRT
jgi:chromosome partitioning protein